MNTYTEEELKAWFEAMIEKYPNSPFKRSLEHVRNEMFGIKYLHEGSLEKFIDNWREEKET